MNLTEILKERYSTKEFDPSKTISDEHFSQLKDVLRLSPSSTNLQPWHFIIANTKAGKERITKGTQDSFQFNTAKIMDASHVVVFCSRVDADQPYLDSILEQEDKDGRFKQQEFKDQMKAGRKKFTDIHKFDLKDLPHWLEKQVYLNMGALLLGAAALGIDAVPMEGIDTNALSEEFDLKEKGYIAIAVISLGYRKATDFNAALPKSRFPEERIITLLD